MIIGSDWLDVFAKNGRTKTRRNAIAFSLIMLTIDNIKKLIAKDETRTLELKKTTGDLYKNMETACVFLNSDGGW